MLHRCLSCYTPFPSNRTLEHMPGGRRVAFDPVTGRLWAICSACSRWSLEPMETRWETLETLERLSRGPARLLKQGENIALFGMDDIEIVRVGRADRREEAWWRYGSTFLSRRGRARRITRTGKVLDGLTMLAVVGIPYWGHSDPVAWLDRARRRSFGGDAWRGTSHCAGCGDVLDAIRFAERADLYIDSAGPSVRLWYWCVHCGVDDVAAGHALAGFAAEHVLRRILAYENFAGGNEDEVGEAMALVGKGEAPEMMVGGDRAGPIRLASLGSTGTLAMEIALNSGLEARLLEEEVAGLEARWREEEGLARIIDGELTTVGRPTEDEPEPRPRQHRTLS